MTLEIEYVPLSELLEWPRNPKDHDLGQLHLSVERFGFVTPFVKDERTGYLGEGAGRMATLRQRKSSGAPPPKNVNLADDGEWLVPVVTGNEFESDQELEAFIVAANQLTIAGGWDEVKLAAILTDLAEQGEELLHGTAFDMDYLNQLLSDLNPLPFDDLVSDTDFGEAPEEFAITVFVATPDQRDKVVGELTRMGYRPEVKLRR